MTQRNYQLGEVVDGLQYLGGDPTKPASWREHSGRGMPMTQAPVEKQSDLWTGAKHGLISMKGTFEGAVGLAGATVGNDAVRDWGLKKYQDTMGGMEANSREQYHAEGVKTLGDAADFAQYWLGYGISNIVAGLGQGALGAAAVKKLAAETIETGAKKFAAKELAEGRAKDAVESKIAEDFMRKELTKKWATRGFTSTMAPQAFVQELGATYGEAKALADAEGRDVDDIDLARVWTYGTLAGATEFGSDILTAGAMKFGPAKDALRGLTPKGKVSGRLARGGAVSQAEGITEMAQTGLEEMGAGKSLSEANFADPTSYFAGVIPGGAVGLATSPNTPLDPNTPKDLLSQQIGEYRDQEAAEAPQRNIDARMAAEEQRQRRGDEVGALVARTTNAGLGGPLEGTARTQRESELTEAFDEFDAPSGNFYLDENGLEVPVTNLQHRRMLETGSLGIEADRRESLPSGTQFNLMKDGPEYTPVNLSAPEADPVPVEVSPNQRGLGLVDQNIFIEPEISLQDATKSATGADIPVLTRAQQNARKRELTKTFETPTNERQRNADWTERLLPAGDVAEKKALGVIEPKNSDGTPQTLSPRDALVRQLTARVTNAEQPATARDRLPASTTPVPKLNAEEKQWFDQKVAGKNFEQLDELGVETTSPKRRRIIDAEMAKIEAAKIATIAARGKDLGERMRSYLKKDSLLSDDQIKYMEAVLYNPGHSDSQLAKELGKHRQQITHYKRQLAPKLAKIAQQEGLTLAQTMDGLLGGETSLLQQKQKTKANEKQGEIAAETNQTITEEESETDGFEYSDSSEEGDGGIDDVEVGNMLGYDTAITKADTAEAGSMRTVKSANSTVVGAALTKEEKASEKLLSQTDPSHAATQKKAGKIWTEARKKLEAQLSAAGMPVSKDTVPTWRSLTPEQREKFTNDFVIEETDVEEASFHIMEMGKSDPATEVEETTVEETPRVAGATEEAITSEWDRANKFLEITGSDVLIDDGSDDMRFDMMRRLMQEGGTSLAQAVDSYDTLSAEQKSVVTGILNKLLKSNGISRNNGGNAFRLDTKKRKPGTVEQVNTWLKKPMSKLASWVNVEIVQSTSDLPLTVESNTGGMYYQGTVYLVADNISTRREAVVTLTHEAVGHMGMEQMLGREAFDKLVRSMEAMKKTSQPVKKLVAKIQKNYADTGGNYTLDARQEAREIIAHMAESNPNFGLIRQIAAKVRVWLAKMGLGDLSTAELNQTIVNAAQFTTQELTTQLEAVLPSPEQTRKDELAALRRTGEEFTEQYLGKTGKRAYRDLGEMLSRAKNSTKFLHDLIKDAKGRIPSLETWYNSVNETGKRRRELASTAEEIAGKAKRLSQEKLREVNKFVEQATVEQKWWTNRIGARDVKRDASMAAKFAQLDANQQEIVTATFLHGEKMRAKRDEVVKQLGLKSEFFSQSRLDGPYAPLKRFGKYVTVLRSKTLHEAENVANPDEKLIEELKADPVHYVVSFFDTKGLAAEFEDANKARFAGGVTASFRKTELLKEGSGPDHKVLTQVMTQLNANSQGIPEEVRKHYEQIIVDMYTHSLGEHNARLQGLKRKTRAGYSTDMMRAFIEHARAETAFLTNMEFGGKTNEAFVQAHLETQRGGRKHQDLFNLVTSHYNHMLDHKTGWATDVQKQLTAVSTVWLLTTSIGYHLNNATQPWMATLPRLAADFNDYTGAFHALTKAYKVALAVAHFSPTDFETSLNLNNADPEMQKVLEQAQLMGVLDVGMEDDLIHFSRSQTGYQVVDDTTGVMAGITSKLYQVARYVESLNRIATAVAAHNLAEKSPGALKNIGARDSTEYAINMIQDTQGNFSETDTPLLLKSIPKVTGQYRKYQFLMGWLYAKAFNQAFNGESAEIKAMGRRMLGYKLMHAGMASGVLGLPMMNVVGTAVSMFFGDDDEPFDFERWAKEHIGDNKLADALLNGPIGAFTGLDLAAKLSEDNIFSVAPYTEWDFSSGDGLKALAYDLGAGPVGAVMARWAEGVGYMQDGEPYKAVEKSVPKGVSNIMEAYRLGTEGYTRRNGDVIVEPHEISKIALAGYSLGIPVAALREIKWTRSQQYQIEQFYREKSQSIRDAYVKAARAHDRSAMRELTKKWTALQNGKKDVRKFFNNSPDALRYQSIRTLTQAPRAADKRARQYKEYMSTD